MADAGVAPIAMPDRQDDAGFAAYALNVDGLSKVVRDRLLDEDVLSRARRRSHDFEVGAVGSGDDHAIQSCRGQHGVETFRGCAMKAPREFPALVLVTRKSGCEFNASAILDGRRQHTGPPSNSNDANANTFATQNITTPSPLVVG
jgi:hypothetical protein